MNRIILSISLSLLFTIQTARADTTVHFKYDNEISCNLKNGYSVSQLYAFRTAWMAETSKHGYGPDVYRTEIYFPVYSDTISTDPLFFLWRGEFLNGEIMGRLAEFFPANPVAARLFQIANCGKASLWFAPEK